MEWSKYSIHYQNLNLGQLVAFNVFAYGQAACSQWTTGINAGRTD